jgi:hypothetical protein
MIDGKFSAMVAKRWNFSLQLTNRSKDSTYKNTDLSIWQFNTKLKYFLSNSINITGWYYFVDSKQGLNGGVDVDSLEKIPPEFNIGLYSPQAPVLYPNQKLDVLQHSIGLRTLVTSSENSKLDLSLYYKYSLDELRDFRDSLNIKEDKKNKSFGTVLNYLYQFDFITLQLLGDYERVNYEVNENYGVYSTNGERYSIGGIISLNTLDDMLKLSLFYKQGYKEITHFNYSGIGTDLKYLLTRTISLYAGYSIRDEFGIDEKVPSIEGGACYKNSNLVLDLKYFNNEYFSYYRWLGGPEYYREYTTEKISGLGLILNYKFWLLLLETNTSYYFKVENEQPKNLPDWQFIGGLYVNDLFFDDNLDLKAGFKFYYTGKINSIKYYWQSSTILDPSNKLDFTLAGEIQKVAIFYFIWENLFGNEYYITPYYPMPERNIRFGLAWELFN